MQYASIFACNGSATTGYDNSNACNNNAKQESSGFVNLDGCHENHSDERDDSDSDTRKQIPGGIWTCNGVPLRAEHDRAVEHDLGAVRSASSTDVMLEATAAERLAASRRRGAGARDRRGASSSRWWAWASVPARATSPSAARPLATAGAGAAPTSAPASRRARRRTSSSRTSSSAARQAARGGRRSRPPPDYRRRARYPRSAQPPHAGRARIRSSAIARCRPVESRGRNGAEPTLARVPGRERASSRRSRRSSSRELTTRGRAVGREHDPRHAHDRGAGAARRGALPRRRLDGDAAAGDGTLHGRLSAASALGGGSARSYLVQVERGARRTTSARPQRASSTPPARPAHGQLSRRASVDGSLRRRRRGRGLAGGALPRRSDALTGPDGRREDRVGAGGAVARARHALARPRVLRSHPARARHRRPVRAPLRRASTVSEMPNAKNRVVENALHDGSTYAGDGLQRTGPSTTRSCSKPRSRIEEDPMPRGTRRRRLTDARGRLQVSPRARTEWSSSRRTTRPRASCRPSRPCVARPAQRACWTEPGEVAAAPAARSSGSSSPVRRRRDGARLLAAISHRRTGANRSARSRWIQPSFRRRRRLSSDCAFVAVGRSFGKRRSMYAAAPARDVGCGRGGGR